MNTSNTLTHIKSYFSNITGNTICHAMWWVCMFVAVVMIVRIKFQEPVITTTPIVQVAEVLTLPKTNQTIKYTTKPTIKYKETSIQPKQETVNTLVQREVEKPTIAIPITKGTDQRGDLLIQFDKDLLELERKL